MDKNNPIEPIISNNNSSSPSSIEKTKKKKRRKKRNDDSNSNKQQLTSPRKSNSKKKSPRKHIKSPRKKEDSSVLLNTKKKRKRSKKKQTKIRWKHIPNEIKVKIFSYLSINDINNITLVCKSWETLFYNSICCIDFLEIFPSRNIVTSLPNDWILNFILKFSNIQYLSLCSCIQLTSDSLHFICEHFFYQLETLIISECELITKSSIPIVCKLPNLKRLDIAMCENISQNAIQYISEKITTLTYLDLSCNPEISDKLISCLHFSEQLLFLNLSGTGVTGKILGYLPSNITHLSFNSCPNINLKTIGGYLHHYDTLVYLDLSYCDNISKYNLYNDFENMHQYFNDSDDDDDDDDDDEYFQSSNSSQLITVNAIIPYISQLPALSSLILRGNIISNSSLQHIAGMNHLTLLDLYSCNGFNMDGLALLTECPSLESIDLTCCLDFHNKESIEFILLYFGHFKTVYLPTGQYFKDWKPIEEITETESTEEE